MEIMGVLRPSQTSPHPRGVTTRALGIGLLPIWDYELVGLGEGVGPQAVVYTSEGTYSILNTAVKEVGTLWSQCGRARKLGHLARRFPEETPIFRSLRRMGMGQLLTGKPVSGSYSHPLCCLTTKVLLTQRPDSEIWKRPQCYIQTNLGSHPGSGSGRLLDPRHVIPLFATWFLCL